MKMTNYISQLNGKEKNALFCIKKLIAAMIKPLVIYCFGCEVTVRTKRSAFITKQFKEERHFTCDMFIIMPDESVIDEEMKSEIQEMTAHFGRLNMLIHPLGFVLKQMNEGNLFFNWVRKNGMLLFERNATTQLMPEVIGGEYKQQAEQFYSTYPQMENYLEQRLQPVATAAPQKKSDPSIKPVEIRLTLDATNGWQRVNATGEKVAGNEMPVV
ncbi:MAG TPA: hypothetical protein VFF80_02605 [Bacillota bacterium]|nr:hypothetical protein [Bacillota bacterium]